MIRSSSSCFQYLNEKLLWIGWDEKQRFGIGPGKPEKEEKLGILSLL